MTERYIEEPAPDRLIQKVREVIRESRTPEWEEDAVSLCRKYWNKSDAEVRKLLEGCLGIRNPGFYSRNKKLGQTYPHLAKLNLNNALLKSMRGDEGMVILKFRKGDFN